MILVHILDDVSHTSSGFDPDTNHLRVCVCKQCNHVIIYHVYIHFNVLNPFYPYNIDII